MPDSTRAFAASRRFFASSIAAAFDVRAASSAGPSWLIFSMVATAFRAAFQSDFSFALSRAAAASSSSFTAFFTWTGPIFLSADFTWSRKLSTGTAPVTTETFFPFGSANTVLGKPETP